MAKPPSLLTGLAAMSATIVTPGSCLRPSRMASKRGDKILHRVLRQQDDDGLAAEFGVDVRDRRVGQHLPRCILRRVEQQRRRRRHDGADKGSRPDDLCSSGLSAAGSGDVATRAPTLAFRNPSICSAALAASLSASALRYSSPRSLAAICEAVSRRPAGIRARSPERRPALWSGPCGALHAGALRVEGRENRALRDAGRASCCSPPQRRNSSSIGRQ